jgi:hypothetical protein
MAISANAAALNAILDSGIDTLFNNGTLDIRSGSAAGAGSAATGASLCPITLPADCLAAASGGAKAKAGTWSGVGVAAANASHFRFTGSGGAVIEGSVTVTGGGGDMTIDNVSIAVDQGVTVTGFTFSLAAA